MTGMPSALAFSSFDPASAPTTRAVVFFETLSATCPPADSISSAALARDSDGREPVTTYICPASGPSRSAAVGSVKLRPNFSRRSSSLRFRGSSKNPATASAIAGPTPRILLISSTEALRSVFIVPKRRASSFAPCAPTWRIPSAYKSVERGCFFEAWIASTSCCADFSANPSNASRSVGFSSYRSATSLMSLAWSSARTRSYPRPRMSITAATWTMLSRIRPGHEAALRTLELPLLSSPAVAHGPQHLRDDLAGTRDFHPVALANVLCLDQVEVVERGGGDRDASDLHGIEHGVGHERDVALHVDPDLLELGDLDLGREFARDGPTRLAVPNRTQLGVQLDRVHLHHDAVGAVVERGEELLELRDLRVGLFENGGEGVVPLDRKAPSHERFQQLVLCRDGELLAGRLDVEAEDSQAAAARDLGIELPQRSRGGIARVGERGLARLLTLAVQLGEAGLGKVDLAAHLHQPGPPLAREPQRHVDHRAQVGGDVFAHQAVAARGADHEHPLFVCEAHRGAVDFHFQRVAGGTDLWDEPGVAILPFGELRLVERVGERQHRHQMAVLLERRRRFRADALRGAVGSAELGMLGLELLQLAKQAVVLGVGQLRLVEYVVGVVGALDEPPQLGGPCGRTLHRPLASS